jgi:hypothetical protein
MRARFNTPNIAHFAAQPAHVHSENDRNTILGFPTSSRRQVEISTTLTNDSPRTERRKKKKKRKRTRMAQLALSWEFAAGLDCSSVDQDSD